MALIREAEIAELELKESKISLKNEKNELIEKIYYLKTKEQLLTEQVEYYLRRKFEKEKLLEINESSTLEFEIVKVDVDSAKAELFSNSVEIFLSILELYNLNGISIYNLFLTRL